MILSNPRRRLFSAIAMAVVCGWTASPARADIYEWTTDAQGDVIQSSTLCPSGSGVNAAAVPISAL